MSPQTLGHAFLDALTASGIRGELTQALPYGQKLQVTDAAGHSLGMLKIYLGKKGPRLVEDELGFVGQADREAIAKAWSVCTGSALPSHHRISPPTWSTTNTVDIWVDGAMLNSPTGSRFGWAYVAMQDGQELQRASGSTVPDDARSHCNVAAELQATIEGLQWCVQAGHRTVTVYHDYEGIARWVTGAWKTKTPVTMRYVATVRSLPLRIQWKKIRAHSGVALNELVDRLANTAASIGS